mmetsp:Transcript_41791/g.105057  ORF Transcript_41791/g.105057 Transcript_41791/m.105057 type:complete len:330 (+) Transcript_41791:1202-2191(+)
MRWPNFSNFWAKRSPSRPSAANMRTVAIVERPSSATEFASASAFWVFSDKLRATAPYCLEMTTITGTETKATNVNDCERESMKASVVKVWTKVLRNTFTFNVTWSDTFWQSCVRRDVNSPVFVVSKKPISWLVNESNKVCLSLTEALLPIQMKVAPLHAERIAQQDAVASNLSTGPLKGLEARVPFSSALIISLTVSPMKWGSKASEMAAATSNELASSNSGQSAVTNWMSFFTVGRLCSFSFFARSSFSRFSLSSRLGSGCDEPFDRAASLASAQPPPSSAAAADAASASTPNNSRSNAFPPCPLNCLALACLRAEAQLRTKGNASNV